MDPRSIELLELPAVRARLAAEAAFPAGQDLALAVAPSRDRREVERLQAETLEALDLARLGVSPPAGAHDVRAAARAAQRGAALDPEDLEAVLVTVEVALEVRAALLAHVEDAPLMAGHAGCIDALALRQLEGPLARSLDRHGGLLDTATPELA
ncbi:MAG: hypothetical protein AB1416_05545, partial [Actinomycetota bacterium]